MRIMLLTLSASLLTNIKYTFLTKTYFSNCLMEGFQNMKLNSKKPQTTDKQAILLLIIIGIQILYSGYMILMGVVASAGLDIKLLVNPTMLFSLGIWAVILCAGINFFRGKTHGWYGVASLYIILLLKNILIFISIISVLLFKESLFKNIQLPAIKLNSNILWVIIESVICGIMIKLLFSTDTINGFSIRNNTKSNIIVKVSVIVVIAIALYFGVGFLLLK